ncbi:hypothetical protein SALBM135S_08472 [Streptomyces alboniger]
MGSSLRRLALAAGAAFLCAGTLAGPAAADIGPQAGTWGEKTGIGAEACPENSYCLYDQPDFNKNVPNGGKIWYFTGTHKVLPVGGDQAASLYNNTDGTVSVFRDWLHSTTQCLTLPPFSVHRDLGVHDISDAISSASTLPALSCRS